MTGLLMPLVGRLHYGCVRKITNVRTNRVIFFKQLLVQGVLYLEVLKHFTYCLA